MKSIFSKPAILFLLFSFAYAHGEIYSWVDNDGKKHFGENVPREYLNQRAELQVKPTNISPTSQAAQSEPSEQQHQKERTQPQVVLSKNKLSSCEQKKREYEESAKCYLGCRRVLGDKEHPIYNVSKCDHCVDVKKPTCD